MKMKLFETLKLKFEEADWANNPEFGLVDSILEQHPGLVSLLENDIVMGEKRNTFGRRDTPKGISLLPHDNVVLKEADQPGVLFQYAVHQAKLWVVCPIGLFEFELQGLE